jgi:hypothetical protein
MRDNYLKEKRLHEVCRCGYVIRAENESGLERERNAHDERCLLLTRADHWSVAVISA